MLKTKKQKGLSLNQRNTIIGLSFILPNFIGFCTFILGPVIFSFALSLMQWDGFTAMEFVGFENFIDIFGEEKFIDSLFQTGYYAVFTVSFSMAISLAMALLLNRKLVAVGFFRSAVFFPYVASVVAVGAVWNALFMKEIGPINTFLTWIGISDPPGWFTSVQWAMPAVIVVSVWKNTGYFMVIYLAALQGIPSHLYEAAAIEGANRWSQFWRITCPLLTSTHFFVFMMLTINSFKVFDLIVVLTGGGPGTATYVLANYIYNKSFVAWDFGSASAASIVLFLIVGTITILQFRLEKKFNDFV